MAALELDFDIPEPAGAVRHWFMEALRALADASHREKPGVELMLDEPTATTLDAPDEEVIVTEIAVTAHRTVTSPVPSSFCPEFVIEDFEVRADDLGTVMVFRLCGIGSATYVWASCEERPATSWKIFEDFLKQVQARYPTIGPVSYKSAARRRRRTREALAARRGRAQQNVPAKGARQGASPEDGAPPPEHAAGKAQPGDPLSVIKNDDYREMVRLWNEGFTEREVGDLCGRSPGTVGNLISELRKKHGAEVVHWHH